MKMGLHVPGVCFLALIVGSAGAARSAAAEPKSIGEVGELGENIYDCAKDKQWDKAAEKLSALKKEAESLVAEIKGAGDAKAELARRIAALDKSVPAKDQQTTLQEANQITLLAANLTDPFHPKTPTDITRLDFYGRELEIWSAAKDAAKLKSSTAAL